MPRVPAGASGSRQHQVHDVLRQVVLAGTDEDLGAGDRVGAVRLGLGAGFQDAEVGAAVRLREAHRARPVARDHLRQVGALECVAAVGRDRERRALGESRVHAPRHVARYQHLPEGQRETARQALATPGGIGGHRDPAVPAVAVVGFLEAGRGPHLAVFEDQAVDVAHAVGGSQHVFGEACAFLQDALEQLAVEVFAPVLAVVFLEVEHVVDDKTDVTERSAVRVHDRVLW